MSIFRLDRPLKPRENVFHSERLETIVPKLSDTLGIELKLKVWYFKI